jgi:hypothetical protein
MTEFMLLIRNDANHATDWEPDRKLGFLKACEAYIGELQRAGQLLSAQPLVRTGAVVAKAHGEIVVSPFERAGEIQVGYYHIRAASLDDAIAIAKRNPEIVVSETARIEVRPLKTVEPKTGFDYPTK